MLPVGAVIYVGSLLASYSKAVTRKYQARDMEAARLSAQLAEARLAALRMQLNPHFLFNSLNAIAGLVREGDNRKAVRLLALLSDVLRQALSTSDVQEVPLRQELKFIEEYLEIEHVRFPDRLDVQCRVEADVLDALVPSFILQPIVENALNHGIHQRSARGHLAFEATHLGDSLRLIVSDDGPGVTDEAPTRGAGVGLNNTRARLRQLYGHRARLSLLNAQPAGAMVIIELPYHIPAAPSAAPPVDAEAPHV
jgi:LytS/YehU family sensor histidine kinase